MIKHKIATANKNMKGKEKKESFLFFICMGMGEDDSKNK